ncbi:MAG: TlpA disulfide reductase family protein, partial [Pseudomonadota bacterium]
MKGLATPRLWIFVWGGLGAAFLAYFLVAASQQPGGASLASCAAPKLDARLAKGEMADFAFAFTPRAAPNASFSRAGEAMTLSDFRGRTVLVNFWATWCAPCLKELPSLDALEGAVGSDRRRRRRLRTDPIRRRLPAHRETAILLG